MRPRRAQFCNWAARISETWLVSPSSVAACLATSFEVGNDLDLFTPAVAALLEGGGWRLLARYVRQPLRRVVEGRSGTQSALQPELGSGAGAGRCNTALVGVIRSRGSPFPGAAVALPSMIRL